MAWTKSSAPPGTFELEARNRHAGDGAAVTLLHQGPSDRPVPASLHARRMLTAPRTRARSRSVTADRRDDRGRSAASIIIAKRRGQLADERATGGWRRRSAADSRCRPPQGGATIEVGDRGARIRILVPGRSFIEGEARGPQTSAAPAARSPTRPARGRDRPRFPRPRRTRPGALGQAESRSVLTRAAVDDDCCSVF